MTKFIIREKWPRRKSWEAIEAFDQADVAQARFAQRSMPELEDGYRISGAPTGKIRVQLVRVEILNEATL